MNHPTPELLVSKKMKSAHAVNAAEREFETLRFMRSEERRIFGEPCKKNARTMPGVTRKVHVCCSHASSSLLTFHLTKKRVCAWLYVGLDKKMRAYWYVFRMREEHSATQEIPSASSSELEEVRWSLFTRFRGYASCRKGLPSPPSWKLMLTPGQAVTPGGGQEGNDTLTYILFSAPRHSL